MRAEQRAALRRLTTDRDDKEEKRCNLKNVETELTQLILPGKSITRDDFLNNWTVRMIISSATNNLLISNDRKPYSEPHPEEARNTVAGNMAGDLGFAGGKNERTMEQPPILVV